MVSTSEIHSYGTAASTLIYKGINNLDNELDRMRKAASTLIYKGINNVSDWWRYAQELHPLHF